MTAVRELLAGSRAAVALATACAAATTALSLSLGALVGRIVDGRPGTDALAVGVLAAFVARAGFAWVRRDLRAEIGRRVSASVGGALLDRAFALPLPALQDPELGGIELVARFEGHREARDAVTDAALGVGVDLVTAVLAAAALAAIDLRLAAIAAVCLPALPLAASLARRASQAPQERAYDAGCRTMRRFVDAVADPRALKAHGASGWARDRVAAPFADELRWERAVGRIRAASSAGSELLASLALLAVLVAGASEVARGVISRGDALFAFTVVGCLLGPVESLSQLGPALVRARVALARIDAVLARAPEASGGRVVGGDLELRDVTFGYRDGAPVLRGVSLTVPAGASVAVIGPSGSGKSTLVALLLGLYRPWSGEVCVGGIDLASVDVDLDGWRRACGVVLQRTVLVCDTVAENVAFGRGSSRDEVLAALDAADARAFVDALPAGIDTVLTGDHALSGGQAQRIGVARALCGATGWLMLDEATSNLDADTEGRVLRGLAAARPGGAHGGSVIVAHHPAAVRAADLIVVVDRGRVVERGTPAELLARGGAYARMLAQPIDGARAGAEEAA